MWTSFAKANEVQSKNTKIQFINLLMDKWIMLCLKKRFTENQNPNTKYKIQKTKYKTFETFSYSPFD